jgi:hypothetical protein
MKSHTGVTMSLGKGSPFSSSITQKFNTKSSTEAELAGADDGMPLILWTRQFLIEQGYKVTDNVVYQDNQSAILLERNGRASSGHRTRQVNIRYFFVADRVKNGELKNRILSHSRHVGRLLHKASPRRPLQATTGTDHESVRRRATTYYFN